MRFDDRLPDAEVNRPQQHPLRDAALLTLGVVGLCIVLVFAVAGAINLVVPLIPPSIESRIFSLIDFEDELTNGEESDDRAAYIQTLVDDLAAHWADLPFPLRTGILDDSTPNAFAIPGGTILVTKGLLDSVSSESELAFVLGHEIGHFQQRDHLRGLGRGLALVLVSYGLDLGGTRGAMSLVKGTMGIADRHFDRGQESGADRFGLELLFQQYGHVAGATHFFQKADGIPSGEADTSSHELDQKLEGYFSTHPVDEHRARALEELADKNGWPRSGDPAILAYPPAPE